MKHFLPNGKKLVIRRPEVRDAQIFLDCFLQLHKETDFLLNTYEEVKQSDHAGIEKYIYSFLFQSNDLLLIAEVEGKVIGILSLTRADNQKEKHRTCLFIAVLHQCWNMGIGRRLMTEAIRWIEENPGITTIHIEVLANNERAIQLFRNFSCIEHGRVPQAVQQSNGELVDLVFMSKHIKP